ncbi:MAG: phosphatase PAP2 family protein [Bacteriovorax sp.]
MLAFFEFTDTDVRLQEHLYVPLARDWIINVKDLNHIYYFFFYTAIKIPIYLIGLGALIATIISWKKNKWREYRKGLIVATLTLIILPTSIALVGKKAINVQCPSDLSRYNGTVPYVKLFEPYPKNPNSPNGKWPEGHCWPAGHASGGFALLSLVCLFKSRRNKILAFIFAMSMGWIMGVYQMLRGAHFLSHHLTTMFLAFILISSLNLLIKDYSHESVEAKN